MSYDRASVLESYGNTNSLRAACAETGCPPYIAYIWHCAISGTDTRMCPGRSDLAELVDQAFPGEVAS